VRRRGESCSFLWNVHNDQFQKGPMVGVLGESTPPNNRPQKTTLLGSSPSDLGADRVVNVPSLALDWKCSESVACLPHGHEDSVRATHLPLGAFSILPAAFPQHDFRPSRSAIPSSETSSARSSVAFISSTARTFGIAISQQRQGGARKHRFLRTSRRFD
jgi:hypothetical protein